MGKRSKLTLWLVVCAVALLALSFIFIRMEARRMHEQIYSTVHVVISLAADAGDVQQLDMDLCGMKNMFTRFQLLDTISENLSTWDREEHCPVIYTVGNLDGSTHRYQLDSLEHHTSGWHEFQVFGDSVSYDYWP